MTTEKSIKMVKLVDPNNIAKAADLELEIHVTSEFSISKVAPVTSPFLNCFAIRIRKDNGTDIIASETELVDPAFPVKFYVSEEDFAKLREPSSYSYILRGASITPVGVLHGN